MSESDGRIARLERALQQGLSIDLNEYNDPAQNEAKAKQDAADQKDADKAAADAAKADEKAADDGKKGGN